MTNKTKKIVSFALTLLMVVAMTSSVLATDLLDPSSITGTPTNTSATVGNLMGQILGIVQVVAIGIAVIMIVVMGIRYISAGPNDKSDIKKNLTTFVLGAVLLFGASGILEIIKRFVGTATK